MITAGRDNRFHRTKLGPRTKGTALTRDHLDSKIITAAHVIALILVLLPGPRASNASVISHEVAGNYERLRVSSLGPFLTNKKNSRFETFEHDKISRFLYM